MGFFRAVFNRDCMFCMALTLWLFAQAVDGWYQVDQNGDSNSSDLKARTFFVAMSMTLGCLCMGIATFLCASNGYNSV
eukprot:m.1292762 g.1292762  ORF g.1292762 m.1292762 type:complete len:78 (+) comp24787_c0_seq16:158-391(+)